MKKYYYLYVFSIDMEGKHDLICGKLFFDEETAKDEARKWLSMVGYHAQILEGNNVVFEA